MARNWRSRSAKYEIDALPGYNPARGDLAARVFFFARRNLAAESGQGYDNDNATDVIGNITDGVDPLFLLMLREFLETSAPVQYFHSLPDAYALAHANGISLRTAQRRIAVAREAALAELERFLRDAA